MRGAYLKPTDPNSNAGCRGGVGSSEGDYELEIGQGKHASPEMIALCVHIDEILEYLDSKCSSSPMARMILVSIEKETKKLQESINQSVRSVCQD